MVSKREFVSRSRIDGDGEEVVELVEWVDDLLPPPPPKRPKTFFLPPVLLGADLTLSGFVEGRKKSG